MTGTQPGGGAIVVRLVGAVGLGVGASACGVALLATSGWLISRAAQHPPVLYLMVAIVGVRAFGLGRAVLTYAERLVGHDAAFRVLGRLRERVYRRLARLGPATLRAYRPGDLGGRIVDDVDAVLDLLLRALLPTVTALVVAGGAVYAVALLVPSAGWLLAGATLAAAGGAAVAVGATRRAAATVPARRADLATATTALLHGLPDLLAYGAANLDEVERCDRRLRRAEARGARAAGAGAAVVVAATGLAACGALTLAVDAVRAGRLDGRYLAVVALVPLALADVFGTLPDAAHHARRGWASLRRVRALVAGPAPDARLRAPSGGVSSCRVRALAEAAPEPAPDAGNRARPPYDVVVQGVTARWPGAAEPVLDGLDVTVPAGQRVAVVGPSGVGKSTLANVVLGQLAPEAGQVRVGGLVVGPETADAVRAVVGYCAQDAYVFDSTVAENVRLARPEATDAEVRAALDAARLGDWVASLPAGAETRVGEHGNRVSGGQRQRLALARTLLADTPVVVLDEPAEHLDEPTADAVMRDLLDATSGRTVLLLTHRTADLRRVDRVYRLIDSAATDVG